MKKKNLKKKKKKKNMKNKGSKGAGFNGSQTGTIKKFTSYGNITPERAQVASAKGEMDTSLGNSPRLSLGMNSSCSQQIVDGSGKKESDGELQVPNKKEMIEMFQNLEKPIKYEMTAIRN
ncbi:unnamed protein product, partial [Staurois parvus]